MDKKRSNNNSDDLLLAILEVLKNKSSENNPLTVDYITKAITNPPYDSVISNKKSLPRTVGEKLENINQYYRNVHSSPSPIENELSFYYRRDFSDKELEMLINDVMFTRMHTVSQVETLTKKLKTMATLDFQKKIIYLDQLPYQQYTASEKVMENLSIIREVIFENKTRTFSKKWLIFNFMYYGEDKEFHKKVGKSGQPLKYQVLPLRIVEANGAYYLICYQKDRHYLSHYRIDLMDVVDKVDVDLDRSNKKEEILISKMRQYNDISKYLSEHLYMFYQTPTDKVVKIILRVFRKDKNQAFNFNFIHKHFAKSYKVVANSEKDLSIDIEVRCLTSAMTIFVRQYLDKVKVVGPEEVKSKIDLSLKKDFKAYFSQE